MWSRFRFGRESTATPPQDATRPNDVTAAAAVVAGVVALIVVGVLAAGCGSGAAATAADEPGTTRVLRVVDGDTIVVRVDGRDERVRLIGVDTPDRLE